MSNRFLTVLRQSGWRPLLRGCIVIAILVAIGFTINYIDFEDTIKSLPFSNSADTPWYRGVIGFVLFGSVAICLSCPRQIISFFAAYFFGLSVGIVAALIATVLACITSFAFARYFHESVRRFIKGKLDIAVQFWRDNTFFATLIIRLSLIHI